MQCGGYATNIKASGCDPSAHTSPTLTQNVVVVLCVRMQWRRVPLNSCPAIFFAKQLADASPLSMPCPGSDVRPSQLE